MNLIQNEELFIQRTKRMLVKKNIAIWGGAVTIPFFMIFLINVIGIGKVITNAIDNMLLEGVVMMIVGITIHFLPSWILVANLDYPLRKKILNILGLTVLLFVPVYISDFFVSCIFFNSCL